MHSPEDDEMYSIKDSNLYRNEEEGEPMDREVDRNDNYNNDNYNNDNYNNDNYNNDNYNENSNEIELRDIKSCFGYGPDALNSFLSKLSDDEQHRYEAFRRAHLAKSAVRGLVQSILGHGIANTSVIVIQSAGKLFVGELVKIALKIQEELGEDGPLQPEHLREAAARFQTQSSFFRSPFIEPGTLL